MDRGKPTSPATARRIIDAYERGDRIDDIASLVGRSPVTVRAVLANPGKYLNGKLRDMRKDDAGCQETSPEGREQRRQEIRRQHGLPEAAWDGGEG